MHLIKCALAIGLAFAAGLATAAVDLTCTGGAEKIEALKRQLLDEEKMIPVTSHFKNVGSDAAPKWAMATLMLNPATGRGYEWAKMPSISSAEWVCVSKRYSDVQLYVNKKLDARAFLDAKVFPRANLASDGKNFSTMGGNVALLVKEKENLFPMYRARVEDILNLTGRPLSTPTAYIEYLFGNPVSSEGVVIGINLAGSAISEYYNVVGHPARDGVKYGAIYSPAAEEMLGIASAGK